MKEEEEAKKVYNLVAEEYHYHRTKKYPHGWFYNEMLEMPATLGLLGNVKGKKILDVGCGTGIYAKLLTKKGAKVKGFDISPEMIKIAREENPKLDLRVGSAYKIPFHEKFDIVLASLMVHYLSDWNKLFSEVSKKLDKGGYFIFSTGNPIAECRKKIKYKGRKFRVFGDYFTEKKSFGKWHMKSRNIGVFFFHRTYETIIKTIIRNGFELADYKDAYPIKKAKKLFPQDYAQCIKVPCFSIWKLKKK